MYQEYYGLKENPFRLAPDARYLYWSQTHQNAFRHLLYSIQSRKNLIVLAGEVGTGKTTLLHVLMEQVKTTEAKTYIAYVVHSTVNAEDLFRYIFHELGLELNIRSKIDYVLALKRFSLQCANQGERLLIILDEAQNYTHEVLEEIRLLSNLETQQETLLQIILTGQLQLVKNINKQDTYQLKQRVSMIYNLLPLNRVETQAYIQRRLNIAGAQDCSFFQEDAIAVIYQYSRGIPRVINLICDHALLYSYAANKRQVGKKIIREVAEDMGLTPEQSPRSADTPGHDEEFTASDGYHADRIVIGYARNYTKRDSGETKNEQIEETDAVLLNNGNTRRNTRSSLSRFFKFSILAIFILIIIFLLQYTKLFSSDKEPTSNKESSVLTENLKKENLSREERPYPQNVLGIEEKPNRDNKSNKYETSNSTKNLENTDSKTYAVVKKGDILQKIILSEYGRYDDSLVKLVLRANPEISDVNRIFVGQRIILPKP
jgi:general secretion pathway protein A